MDQTTWHSEWNWQGLMPHTRNEENRGYPKSWRFRYDAYYYRVPKGQEHLWDGKKEFLFGRSLAEAASEWGWRIHRIEYDSTVDALLTRYKLDVIPTKAATTRRGDTQALINLRKVFGAMRPRDVLPKHIYKYVDTRVSKNGEKSRATGLYEIRVFTHVFTKAVEWGILNRHPFKGEVKLLIGIRRGDMLRLRMSDLTDTGLVVRPHKTINLKRTARIFEWTSALKEAVSQAKAARPIDISPWLFCTSKGECYCRSSDRVGFDVAAFHETTTQGNGDQGALHRT